MRTVVIFLLAFVLFSCDSERVYEKNQDMENRDWLVNDVPKFEFSVDDTTKAYNLYCNIRNSMEYPYSRIFINYSLQDSGRVSVQKNLISAFLFEEKTGKPVGSSGLGDAYDQQVPLLKNYTFKKAGLHSITFEQFMRIDTLHGIHAIGFRLEKAITE